MTLGPLYAHTPNDRGVWHSLKEHIETTATLASENAAVFGARDLGYWVGLLHDIGKAHPSFQDYLRVCAEGRTGAATHVPHSTAGAIWASRKGADFLAFVLAGHHAGLPDTEHLRARLKDDPRQQGHCWEVLGLAVRNDLLPELDDALPKLLPAWLCGKAQDTVRLEMFLRMLFSALVDADYLDTEDHFAPQKGATRQQVAHIGDLWDALRASQDNRIANAEQTLMNVARREMYQQCVEAATQLPGIFRLVMPTGGGKTLSGMSFALRHALAHGLRRVIVAIPYTSIIEQTAQVYRDVFGSDFVVEHHSGVKVPHSAEEDGEESFASLAAENWDARIVVTTTVQLFESLFHNRPSACRKLHNIARSVILLDEVQTLPIHLLGPILDALQDLADNYGVTVVLSTATHPALSGESQYLKGLREVQDIIPNPEEHFDILKRVEYDIVQESWSWQRLAEEMRRTPQSLAVLNTRKDAVTLFETLNDPDTFHLSTLLCGAHRREVLDDIRQRLADGAPCHVVSTQVIEAGIDVDFPVVFRALGPLDRIVQAAGRCNREGRMAKLGRVVVFRPEEGGAPRGAYSTCIAESEKALRGAHVDLNAPGIFEQYFRCVYQDMDTDKKKIQKERAALNFATVAERFRLIDSDTMPVYVTYGEGAELLRQVEAKAKAVGRLTRSDWRKLQPFIVNVFRRDLERYRAQGLSEPKEGFGFDVWRGGYDLKLGLRDVARDPADLVV